jgi:hypothetical protein
MKPFFKLILVAAVTTLFYTLAEEVHAKKTITGVIKRLDYSITDVNSDPDNIYVGVRGAHFQVTTATKVLFDGYLNYSGKGFSVTINGLNTNDEFFIKIFSESNEAKVSKARPYADGSEVVQVCSWTSPSFKVGAGTRFSTGEIRIDESSDDTDMNIMRKALNILDAIIDGYNYVHKTSGTTPQMVEVHLGPRKEASYDNGYINVYGLFSDEPDETDYDDLILHQYAHFIYDKFTFIRNFPMFDFQDSICVTTKLSKEEAFSEGWALYFPVAVKKSTSKAKPCNSNYVYNMFNVNDKARKTYTLSLDLNQESDGVSPYECNTGDDSASAIASVLWHLISGQKTTNAEQKMFKILSGWQYGFSAKTIYDFRDDWKDSAIDPILCEFINKYCKNNCTFTLSKSSDNFGANGGSGSFNVNAQTGCSWTAVSNNNSMITIISGSGTGGGTVSYSVSANSGSQRTGKITVTGQSFTQIFTVNQEASGPSLEGIWVGTWESNRNSQSGGLYLNLSQTGNNVSGTMRLTGSLIINSATISGTSSGNSYTLTAKFQYNGSACTATLTGNLSLNQDSLTGDYKIKGSQIDDAGTFTASKQSSCNYSLSKLSETFGVGGGTGSFNVSAQNGCSWTAVSNNNWITVTSGSSWTGTGVVSYSVGANAGNQRTGTITVTGQNYTQNFNVNQDGSAVNTISDTGDVAIDGSYPSDGDSMAAHGWQNMTFGRAGAGYYRSIRPHSGNLGLEIVATQLSGHSILAYTLPSGKSARSLSFWLYDDDIITTLSGNPADKVAYVYTGNADWSSTPLASIGIYLGQEPGMSYTYYVYSDGSLHTTSVPRSTGWHSFKIEATGSELRWYIDGVQVAQKSSSSRIGSVIFRCADTNYLSAYMDDIVFELF